MVGIGQVKLQGLLSLPVEAAGDIVGLYRDLNVGLNLRMGWCEWCVVCCEWCVVRVVCCECVWCVM